MTFLLKSLNEYLYFCIFLTILCNVQQTKTTKQNINKGQNTSISIALNIVHKIPNVKAKVILSHIYDQLIKEIKGLSVSPFVQNSNYKLLSLSVRVYVSWNNIVSVTSSYYAVYQSYSKPFGVRQLTSSCSKQKPIKQVMTSYDNPIALYIYKLAKRNVKTQRNLRWRIVKPTKQQYLRLIQFIPWLANIFNFIFQTIITQYFLLYLFRFLRNLLIPKSFQTYKQQIEFKSLQIFNQLSYFNQINKNNKTIHSVMQKKNQQQITPIHNKINQKGILRRIDHNFKIRKLSVDENKNNMMLNLINNQYLFQNRIQKQYMYERNTILSSIRCRNLRKKNMQDKRKYLFTAQEKIDLGLEPVKQFSNNKVDIEGKNKSLFNISLYRRTTPIKISFSRSRTARESPLNSKIQQSITHLPGKGLVGYHISSHSPMNKKLAWAVK